jgi:hypothetical protein
LFTLLGDRNPVGIGHAEAEAITEDLFLAPG